MKKQGIRTFAAALLAALLLGALPALAADGEDGAEESSTIDFLSYEEAVTYFDFDTAASNWCTNFAWIPPCRLRKQRPPFSTARTASSSSGSPRSRATLVTATKSSS